MPNKKKGKKKSLVGKWSYTGYLRTLESITPRMVAIFVYKRRNNKLGINKKVCITLEEIK